MSIVSFSFYVFFILTLIIYYLVPHKFQTICLLLFSITFFGISCKWYTFIYITLCAVNTHVSVQYVSKERISPIAARRVVIAGILVDVAMLSVLKYMHFIMGNIDYLIRFITGRSLPLIIPQWASPIGISFYTLSSIGYIIDCYLGKCVPQKSFIKNSLFVCYWPILVSGPIIKMNDILKKGGEHLFTLDNVCSGAQRMLWGIIKKIVISARLGIIVDTIYKDTTYYNGFYIWIAAACFTLQLYTDFSGCMDIVLGASECYGIVLPENFRMPFFSKSIQEFWQRWHATLGEWYKEYILYPILNTKWCSLLEFKLKKKHGRKIGRVMSSSLGMLFVWLLFGLWHGVNGNLWPWDYIFGEL